MSGPADDDLRAILAGTRVIALVGASADPDRPSHRVGWFLARRGYRVIPVNPRLAGQSLFGETVVAGLADIPPDAAVDMVDIFRRSAEVGPVVAAALEVLPALRTVWMQLGVVDDEAAAIARARGVAVVMDRCPAIEIPRLGVGPV